MMRPKQNEIELFFEGKPVTSIQPNQPLQTKTELIRQWSIDRNLHTADPNKQALKLGEEFGELFEGLAKGNLALTKDAIGDMYVVLTIMSQQLGFTIEECIDVAYDEIKDRRGRMIDGVFVKESDLKEDN
jgi:NTP pyrophosphatase (non-canonical NTP hydrolase)